MIPLRWSPATSLATSLAVLLLLASPAVHADRGAKRSTDATEPLFASGPARPSMEQIMHSMGKKESVRMAVRTQPLRAHNVAGLVYSALSGDTKKKYDEFVAKTAFDPIRQAEGLLFASDAPNLDDLDSASHVLMVMPFRGKVYNGLIDYLNEFEGDKDGEDKDKHTWTMALLADLTEAQVRSLASDVDKHAIADGDRYKRTDFDRSHILFVTHNQAKGKSGCMYLWPGGLIADIVPARGRGLDAARLRAPCLGLVRDLDASARTRAPSDLPVASLAGAVPGAQLDIRLSVATDATLSVTFDAQEPMATKLREFVAMVPIAQANPQLVTTSVPVTAAAHPLIEMLVLATTAKMKANVATFVTRVPTRDLLAEIQALSKGSP